MKSSEFKVFDDAMHRILSADPKTVKSAVDAEIQAKTAEREARGEHKRGRKKRKAKPSASVPASSGKG
jgi:hypothetical protein